MSFCHAFRYARTRRFRFCGTEADRCRLCTIPHRSGAACRACTRTGGGYEKRTEKTNVRRPSPQSRQPAADGSRCGSRTSRASAVPAPLSPRGTCPHSPLQKARTSENPQNGIFGGSFSQYSANTCAHRISSSFQAHRRGSEDPAVRQFRPARLHRPQIPYRQDGRVQSSRSSPQER